MEEFSREELEKISQALPGWFSEGNNYISISGRTPGRMLVELYQDKAILICKQVFGASCIRPHIEVDVDYEGYIVKADIGLVHCTSLTETQLSSLTKLFHICLHIKKLRGNYSMMGIGFSTNIPLNTDQQKKMLRRKLGGSICIENKSELIRFEANAHRGVSFTIVEKEFGPNIRLGRLDEEAFPKIVDGTHYHLLQQDMEKIIKAAKHVLGDGADAEIIQRHFEALPEGSEGAAAIKRNKARFSRRNTM